MSILLLIAGLILFVSLIVVHELGHFIAARRNGVDAEEFGIGFPPRLWGGRVKSDKGDYDFSINLLPLGGFVRLKGEHDADRSKGSFGAAGLWAKVKIMMAGVMMNLAAAYVLLLLLALVGMPRIIAGQYQIAGDSHDISRAVLAGYIEPGSPAERAGLKPGDELASIAPAGAPQLTIRDREGFTDTTRELAGRQVTLQYRRDGELRTADVSLRDRTEVDGSKTRDECTGQEYFSKGHLGVTTSDYAVTRSTWSAPLTAAGTAAQFTGLTVKGLGSALADVFSGNSCEAAQQVAGPVGIFVLLNDGTILGPRYILMIIAVLSLTLAIMNALPIPALDGGRLFVTLFYRLLDRFARLFKRRVILTKRAEEWIHGTGFIALMALFVLITVVDVNRFF